MFNRCGCKFCYACGLQAEECLGSCPFSEWGKRSTWLSTFEVSSTSSNSRILFMNKLILISLNMHIGTSLSYKVVVYVLPSIIQYWRFYWIWHPVDSQLKKTMFFSYMSILLLLVKLFKFDHQYMESCIDWQCKILDVNMLLYSTQDVPLNYFNAFLWKIIFQYKFSS